MTGAEDLDFFALPVKHHPVLPKSASWEPESSVTQTEAD